MNNIISILLDKEKIYLKKSRFGYRVVNPIRNNDGSYNLKNLLIGGSWINIIIVGIIVTVILGCLWEYSTNVSNLLECIKNPYSSDFCISLKNQLNNVSNLN